MFYHFSSGFNSQFLQQICCTNKRVPATKSLITTFEVQPWGYEKDPQVPVLNENRLIFTFNIDLFKWVKEKETIAK